MSEKISLDSSELVHNFLSSPYNFNTQLFY